MAPAASAGVVLLYHHVDKSTPAITSISPAMFERHLEIIEEEGFEVIQLDELTDQALAGESSVESRKVAITFDDAYISIYTTAFPMLKARGWPFTIFVATDYVSDTNPYYLSWPQLQDMAENGASIQNHTLSHTHLLRQQEGESIEDWRARVRHEITGATKVLSDRGFETTSFAFTYGEYDLWMLALLEEMGLRGYGQQSGAIGPSSHPQLLPRFPLAGIYVGEGPFRNKLKSLAMPLQQYEQPEPLVTDNFRPELTLTLDSISPGRMTCFGPGGPMELTFPSEQMVTATPNEPVSVGRSRYNCTLPAGKGRYHWFSQLWIRMRDDGTWYPEP